MASQEQKRLSEAILLYSRKFIGYQNPLAGSIPFNFADFLVRGMLIFPRKSEKIISARIRGAAPNHQIIVCFPNQSKI